MEEGAYDTPARIDELVPFCGDGHYHYCFDYRSSGRTGEPSVCFIDVETFDSDEQLAPDFATFLGQLRLDDTDAVYGIVTGAPATEVAASLSKATGYSFVDVGDQDNGYRVFRAKLPGDASWAWLAANRTRRGFVRTNGNRPSSDAAAWIWSERSYAPCVAPPRPANWRGSDLRATFCRMRIATLVVLVVLGVDGGSLLARPTTKQTVTATTARASASAHTRRDARTWKLNVNDWSEVLRLAAHSFQDAKGTLAFADDGHERYATTMRLGGCTKADLWKRPSGVWEFSCQLVPNRMRKKKVSDELDRRLAAVLALLPPDWKVERFPGSTPYLSRIDARDPSRRLRLDAWMTPYVDGSFDATLRLTAGVDPTE